MKIEVETKYNVGDVLYYVNYCDTISKEVIQSIEIVANQDGIHIKYDLGGNLIVWERHMDKECGTSLEEAASIIAQKAICKFNMRINEKD